MFCLVCCSEVCPSSSEPSVAPATATAAAAAEEGEATYSQLLPAPLPTDSPLSSSPYASGDPPPSTDPPPPSATETMQAYQNSSSTAAFGMQNSGFYGQAQSPYSTVLPQTYTGADGEYIFLCVDFLLMLVLFGKIECILQRWAKIHTWCMVKLLHTTSAEF